jgi:phosphate acyltransferase
MSQPRTIALDAMGGDHGPPVVVAGAAISLERFPSLSFVFFGDRARIEAELAKAPALAAKSRIIHTDTTVGMSDKPSQALRRGKGTSLWLAI